MNEPTVCAILQTGYNHDLDGFIFRDIDHARMWLAQGFVGEAGYRVKLARRKLTKCPHCKSKYEKATPRGKWMSPAEFLEATAPQPITPHPESSPPGAV